MNWIHINVKDYGISFNHSTHGVDAPIRDREFLIQLECWDTVTVVVQHPPQSYKFWLPLILEWFSIKTRTPKTTTWVNVVRMLAPPLIAVLLLGFFPRAKSEKRKRSGQRRGQLTTLNLVDVLHRSWKRCKRRPVEDKKNALVPSSLTFASRC